MRVLIPGEDSHMKVTGVIVGNVEKNPLKGTRILFPGRGPNNFLPLRGNNPKTIH